MPDWIGNFQNPDFPALFVDYADAFARCHDWVQLYTPISEMRICALFCACYGWWNEQLTSNRSFVTALKNIVRANVLAMRRILEARSDAIFVQRESSEHCHADDPAAIGIGLATSRRFLAAGARVILADLDPAKAGAALGAEAGDRARCPRSDVADERDVQAAVAGAIARFGRFDVDGGRLSRL